MKRQANIGIELSAEILGDVHGGRVIFPYPQQTREAIEKAAKAIAKAVKSVLNTITSWF